MKTNLLSFSLFFNPYPSTIMHIDLNSCFATIEQQANPFLRGRPVAVAAYTTASGCILAPSVEAKRLGIKVGMRVKDGKNICPSLAVLSPDPWKYRYVHLKLRQLLGQYTDKVTPKSIDEFVLDFAGYPAFDQGLTNIARKIKQRIKEEIGDWLTVSVGIAPNYFLAKLACGLHKPDGLDLININNFKKIYAGRALTDLCGIKYRNTIRLNNFGIFTVLDFYNADVLRLKSAFGSIVGYYWYLRLRGWEIDDVTFKRSSYGNSYALPKPLSKFDEVAPILHKLAQKTGMRLRKAGYRASGVHLAIVFRDGNFWHHGRKLTKAVFDSNDIYKEIAKIFVCCPHHFPIAQLAISCFYLDKDYDLQLSLTDNLQKKERLTKAVDAINGRWGNFVITPARTIGTQQIILDRISFGGVKELEEFVLG